MAQPQYDDIASVLVQPGRLVMNPTDLSLAFPHGGTSLGMTEEGITLNWEKNWQPVVVEEYGQEPIKIIHIGEEIKMSVNFVQWESNVTGLIWQGFTATGGVSGLTNMEWPGSGSKYAGKDMSGSSIILLFSPSDLTNNKVVLFRKAVPLSTTEVEFKASKKTILACEFYAMRDDTIGSGDSRYNSRGIFIGDRRDATI